MIHPDGYETVIGWLDEVHIRTVDDYNKAAAAYSAKTGARPTMLTMSGRQWGRMLAYRQIRDGMALLDRDRRAAVTASVPSRNYYREHLEASDPSVLLHRALERHLREVHST